MLMQELENNFGPHVQAVAVRQELLLIKQNEIPLMEFLPRFRGLAIASGVEDKLLQQILCNALNPSFQVEAFRILPMATFEEYYTFLRSLALHHSAFNCENLPYTPIMTNQINSLSDERHCYSCGRPGHLARNCRVTRRRQNSFNSQGFNTRNFLNRKKRFDNALEKKNVHNDEKEQIAMIKNDEDYPYMTIEEYDACMAKEQKINKDLSSYLCPYLLVELIFGREKKYVRALVDCGSTQNVIRSNVFCVSDDKIKKMHVRLLDAEGNSLDAPLGGCHFYGNGIQLLIGIQ
ncbi:hypothetical protein HMI54_012880 [Coelomomyces lativittatus]|nr:hypothetical protein HMI54_012880 [Coelomomyces lativittatus]